ncbi:hypothetical protein MtrunA17_Chr2g0306131 [Medicago truncatula]|uniref:Transmembrane protein n=1 Tax=Medicago truncatula TaxID=3880 RepID=A0A396J796_MEDTR|nr:hypothetical protein MtrunA17_Chr2g0306131 [Medicago truncatula]
MSCGIYLEYSPEHLLLLLLGLQAILFWRTIYRGIFLEYTCLDFKSIVYYK